MRCSHPRQPELAHIAICEIADPHPPQHGKRHPATRPPAVDCPPLLPDMGGLPGKQLSCGPGTLVSGQQPATTVHQRTASTQPNARTRRFHVIAVVEGGVGNLGNCPIISALPMMRTRQPAQSEGMLYFSSWFNDPQGGIARLLPADATLPGSCEPPSVWNDDGSTKIMDSWHGGVIRVAEKEGWTLSSRWAVWVGQLCVVAQLVPSLPSRPGSGLLREPHSTTSCKDRPT